MTIASWPPRRPATDVFPVAHIPRAKHWGSSMVGGLGFGVRPSLFKPQLYPLSTLPRQGNSSLQASVSIPVVWGTCLILRAINRGHSHEGLRQTMELCAHGLSRASVWDQGYPGGNEGRSSQPLGYPTEVVLALLWWQPVSWGPVRAEGSEGPVEGSDKARNPASLAGQCRPGADQACVTHQLLVPVLYSRRPGLALCQA